MAGDKKAPRSLDNKNNRGGHSSYLKKSTEDIRNQWFSKYELRDNLNLAPIDSDIIPIFFKINPDEVGYDFDLKKYGIEIISEEENGYIIGASLDGFNSLEEKIKLFLNEERGGGNVADLWEIVTGNQWKPDLILSDYLKSNWSNIEDDKSYLVEVGIAFDKPLGKEPMDPEKRGYEKRLADYKAKQIERDDLFEQRQEHFEAFVNHYGKITSSLIDLEDSFCCEIEISGKGLKDLVFNYQFVFEVSEIEKIEVFEGDNLLLEDSELELLPPSEDFPEIAVIDSGIMENHKLISQAIKPENSFSYVDGDTSTADYVLNGGHGTKVAGAVLFPYGIQKTKSPYQLPCFIRNLRVLDHNCQLQNKLPAELMKNAVEDNSDCKIFNLSINSNAPSKTKHMSSWAATIDTLIEENNVLFLISAGNISKDDIKHYLRSGENYPDYLDNKYCRIANPAQSSFAITVGSINETDFEDDDFISIGNKDEISAFSRIGTGIWGMIKPEVVEYGGGLATTKSGNFVVNKEALSPELVRSTYHGGKSTGKDSVGTSFSTPKVTYIAAELLKLYPNDDLNLIRSLIIQGARLPNTFFEKPTVNSIRHFGYGVPSLERVTKNSHQRITFYSTGNIKIDEAHLYSLKIPDFLRNPAEEHDILIEATLTFTSKVRRTRQKTKSYLSSWLDWTSSKIGESFDDFSDFILKEIEGEKTSYDKDARNALSGLNWKIKGDARGEISGISRTNSSAQKDWAFIKSHDLPEEINFAVRCHKGWDKSIFEIPYAFTVSIEILNSHIEIYEPLMIENEAVLETEV